MASSYDNDLRLNEMATGDQSGAWGTVTNLNLEIIAEAFSYGTRVIANASSDEITLADGALDADRSMYLKLTGGGQACTVSLLPNTVSKVWMIENATSATLTFTQGSGANVAVLAGQVKMIATDGAGSGAVVYDLLTDVNLAGTTVTDIITANQATVDDIDLNGKVITMTGSSGDTATLTVAADGALAIATTDAAAAAANISITADGTFTATATTITLDSAGDIILDAAGDEVIFKDGSANIGHVSMDSDNLTIKSLVSDKDIILQGNDGGSGITALTLDMSAAGAATFNSTVTRALTRGSIDVGNSSGVSAPLAKGTAGTVLTSDGTDLSFASIASGMSDMVFPSDWASPNNNYTSSGTWSKGSLSDDDYIWIYLLGGGGGGGARYTGVGDVSNGGAGGYALFIYGQAKYFDGGAYVVGASAAGTNTGGSNNDYTGTPGNPSTFTLTSTYNSLVYTTASGPLVADSDDTTAGRVLRHNPTIDDVIDLTNITPDFTITSQVNYSEILDKGLPTGVSFRYVAAERWYNITGTPYCIFGGGQGGNHYNTSNPAGVSMFAGAGGAMGSSSGGNGTAPGGGGGGVTSSGGVGGTGAQGSVRIYHV